MTNEHSPAEQEFEAISTVHAALAALESDAQIRVLTYVASLLRIGGHVAVHGPAPGADAASHHNAEGGGDERDSRNVGRRDFETFAELFDAANPQTHNEMALVSAYWLQVPTGADSFNAQAASKELANLGHKLSNISRNLTSLKSMKPAYILQLKKSGSTKQARKTYKVSIAGIRRVEAMIDG